MQTEIAKLADATLSLNKQKAQTHVPALVEQLENQIHYTDKKINALVYQLYKLSEEEIKIIEDGK